MGLSQRSNRKTKYHTSIGITHAAKCSCLNFLRSYEFKRLNYPNEMLYKILADIVVFIHFLWIIFLIFGAFLGVKNKAIKIFHLSGLSFSLIIQVFNWYCPLTHLEMWLRLKHHPYISYKGSFIIHYLETLVYIDISRSLIFIFTIFLCSFNIWFYLIKKQR